MFLILPFAEMFVFIFFPLLVFKGIDFTSGYVSFSRGLMQMEVFLPPFGTSSRSLRVSVGSSRSGPCGSCGFEWKKAGGGCEAHVAWFFLVAAPLKMVFPKKGSPFFSRVTEQLRLGSLALPKRVDGTSPRSPSDWCRFFYCFFFGWEGSPTEIDKKEKRDSYSNLSTGGPCYSVVQWHPFPFFFFQSGCPTKNGLPQKGFPFFSRVSF